MDVAGRARPAWMRLVLLFHQVGEEARHPVPITIGRRGGLAWNPCKCVYEFRADLSALVGDAIGDI
jgi:hypothetical protein